MYHYDSFSLTNHLSISPAGFILPLLLYQILRINMRIDKSPHPKLFKLEPGTRNPFLPSLLFLQKSAISSVIDTNTKLKDTL